MGFVKDAEKQNEATLMGFRYLRVCEPHVKDGTALAWIEQALRGPEKPRTGSKPRPS